MKKQRRQFTKALAGSTVVAGLAPAGVLAKRVEAESGTGATYLSKTQLEQYLGQTFQCHTPCAAQFMLKAISDVPSSQPQGDQFVVRFESSGLQSNPADGIYLLKAADGKRFNLYLQSQIHADAPIMEAVINHQG